MKKEQNNWTEIVDKLKKQGMTITTMESCTGGGISNEITNISGASSVLKESYVTYCNESKIKHGVSANIIEKYTVYSRETAIEMANAAKKMANADIAIGVTGQLGRIDPNNYVNKLNYVWFAIMGKNNELFVMQVKVPNIEREEQKKYVIDIIAMSLLDFI